MEQQLSTSQWSSEFIFAAIIMALVLLFVICFFTFRAWKKRKTNRIGKNGEKRVAKVLNQYAKKHGGYALHDIYLPLYDQTTQVDHLLIGDFGVLVVETKAVNGEVFGTESDKEWTHLIGEKRHKLYNPLLQNKAHMDCLVHLLRTEKIYKVQVDSLVVFAGDQIQLNIPKGLSVITLDLLKKYLNKPRFQQACGADKKAIYDMIQKRKVTDRTLTKNHTKNVQKIAQDKKAERE